MVCGHGSLEMLAFMANVVVNYYDDFILYDDMIGRVIAFKNILFLTHLYCMLVYNVPTPVTPYPRPIHCRIYVCIFFSLVNFG